MTLQCRNPFHVLLAILSLVSCSPFEKHVMAHKALLGEGLFNLEAASPDTSWRDSLRRVSTDWLGVPYLWGGEGPDSIDCSGYMQKVFSEAMHVGLPRRAAWQALVGVPVERFELKFGDLVFFSSDTEVDHVGMYWGEGWFINATVSRGVAFSHLEEPFWAGRYRIARRLVIPQRKE